MKDYYGCRKLLVGLFLSITLGLLNARATCQDRLEFLDFTPQGVTEIKYAGDDIFLRYKSKASDNYKTVRISPHDFKIIREYDENDPITTCEYVDRLGVRIVNKDHLEIYDLLTDSLQLSYELKTAQTESPNNMKYIYDKAENKCYIFRLPQSTSMQLSSPILFIYDVVKKSIERKILPGISDTMMVTNILSSRIIGSKVICGISNLNTKEKKTYALYDIKGETYTPIELPSTNGYTSMVSVFDFETSSSIMLHLCKFDAQNIIYSIKKVVFKLDASTGQLEFMGEFKSDELHVNSSAPIVQNEWEYDYSRTRMYRPFKYITYNIGAGGYLSIIKISSNLVKEISFDVKIDEIDEYLLRKDILYIRARSKGKLRELQIDIDQEQLICNEEGRMGIVSSINYPAKSNNRLYVNMDGIDKCFSYDFKKTMLTLLKPE